MKYQIQSRQKEQFLIKHELLWMWFFRIVPIRGRFAKKSMGIVSFPFSENAEALIENWACVKQFLADCINISEKRAYFAGLLAEAFEKRYSVEKALYQEGSNVLPMCCILQHPHSGQILMFRFQTAFRSSAIDRFVYLALKRWRPWIVNISFRFFVLYRLFRKP